jgi:type VI secretion system protein ImpG
MFNKYYQDELNYLRALGAEYAERHPNIAKYLGTGASDPDVERLLQAFAFLTARLHQRLDDQYCQIAEGFLSLVWPQVLKPVPSLVMVQFDASPEVLATDYTLEKGVELRSKRYRWGQYKFQTCRALTIYPFRLINVSPESHGGNWRLRFRFEVNSGASFDKCSLGPLPIYISDRDPRFSYGWYLWFTQYVHKAHLISDNSDMKIPVGVSSYNFDNNNVLIPGSEQEISGHRIIREYLNFPESFLFFQIDSLHSLKEISIKNGFDLLVDFGGRIPSGPMRNIQPNSFKLYCLPAINLFESFGHIPLDYSRTEYLVRSDEHNIERYEVYSLSEVSGIEQGTGAVKVIYHPFYALRIHEKEESNYAYKLRFTDIQMKRENVPLFGRESFISFNYPTNVAGKLVKQTISMQMVCTNRGGASDLKVGDLCIPSEKVPPFITFENIGEATSYKEAPKDGEYLWKLISGLTLSRASFMDKNALKSILTFIENPPMGGTSITHAFFEYLSKIEISPEIILEGGTPLRILKIRLIFGCEQERIGEFYLFGVALVEFLRHVATINTRIECSIHFDREQSLAIKWPRRSGTCQLI